MVSQSSAAAKAAEYVEALETNLRELEQALADTRAEVKAQIITMTKLTSEIRYLEIDRDHWKKRSIEIMTKLTVAGTVILDAMAEPSDDKAADANRSASKLPDTVAGIQAELELESVASVGLLQPRPDSGNVSSPVNRRRDNKTNT